MEPERWLGRYREGEREAVWAELVAAGADVRADGVVEHARAVAHETMDRARANVETLRERLGNAGYRFQYPDDVHVPPGEDTAERLDGLDREIGPLPLSLRAFYERVGTVDLTQSWDQLVHWWPEERPQRPPELDVLGEEDPLVVEPLTRESNRHAHRQDWFFIAPDEFHKANYSGGENYHVRLPDPRADFPVLGMYDIDELFVAYLRATFAGGGFRGRTAADDERAWKLAPDLEITRLLGSGLLPI